MEEEADEDNNEVQTRMQTRSATRVMLDDQSDNMDRCFELLRMAAHFEKVARRIALPDGRTEFRRDWRRKVVFSVTKMYFEHLNAKKDRGEITESETEKLDEYDELVEGCISKMKPKDVMLLVNDIFVGSPTFYPSLPANLRFYRWTNLANDCFNTWQQLANTAVGLEYIALDWLHPSDPLYRCLTVV
jgi:hypothetical protein